MKFLKQLWYLLLLPFRFSALMNRKPTLPFMDAMDQVETGDIFLARGRANISRFIEFVTGSYWSHVGIIIRPSDLGVKIDGDPPHLWESTTHDDVPDFYSKKGKRGAMLVDLAKRIESNLKSGDYKVFGFRYMSVDRTPELLQAYKDFIVQTHGQTTDFPEYQDMIIDLIRHRLLGAAPGVTTYYCSELAVTTMQAVELMPLYPVSKSYLPRDFSERGYAPFLKRATLGPEVYIGAPHQDERYVLAQASARAAPAIAAAG
jgi:hypothetical protein